MTSRPPSGSTNFNTCDMKVCFFDVHEDGTVDALDNRSLKNLIEAADYALRRAAKKKKSNKGFVVVNPSVVFGEAHFGALASHFSTKGARIISTMGDTLVVESKEGYNVSIQMVGGARFVATNSNDSDSDESVAMYNQGLTQECGGL